MPDISVSEIQKKYKKDKDASFDIYQKARDDLRFLSDDTYAQWDEQDYNARTILGKPALTIDQLGQFVHQVANEIKMNTPSIDVIPSDIEASEVTAEVMKGLIREIEYRSGADDAYDTAALSAIRCGIGFIRLDFEYAYDDGFDQQLVIKEINNPLAVLLDSESQKIDGSDAKCAYIIDQYDVADFKKKWPGANPVSFDDIDGRKELKDGETITVAEYFYIDEQYQSVVNPTDSTKTREIVSKTVRRVILSGDAVLEEGTFPGKYIPIIPVYGEELFIDSKRYLFSLIRKSKQAQQMFNYWKSLEMELIMKSPQSPFMAAEGQTEDYAEDWKNPSKSMVLRYRPTDVNGAPAPPPQRLEPPMVPMGVVNASASAVQDIKATMGMYNASLGEMGNEISGVAIQRKQGEGDVATFHFQDNLVKSITHLGCVMVSAIPEIYDAPRILAIIGMEDNTKYAGVNGAVAEGQPETVNLMQGRYDVRVKTGGTYSTKRQEASEFLSSLITSYPEMMSVIGDQLFENLDFAGSNIMAERMKKFVDPKYLEGENEDPQVLALNNALQETQAQMQMMQAQLMEAQRLLTDRQTEYALKAKEIELKQVQIEADVFDDQADNARESEKVSIEALKAQMNYEIEMAKIETERLKATMSAQIQPQELVSAIVQALPEALAQALQKPTEIVVPIK